MQQKEVTTEEATEIKDYIRYYQVECPFYITPPILWAYKRVSKLVWAHTSHVIMNQHLPSYQQSETFKKKSTYVLDAQAALWVEVASQVRRENP